MSPTIFDVEKNTTLADGICYFPFDLPWSIFLFFKQLNPTHFIITRHDIWPHMIVIAKHLGIHTSFINANIHENSIWIRFGFKSFGTFLLQKFDLILTGSNRLKNNMSSLALNQEIIITGDTRFDQILDRSKTCIDHFDGAISNTSNIIFGSIDEYDFPVILECLKNQFPNGSQSLTEKKQRLIIVPHEVDIDTISLINKQLVELNITSVRFTEMDSNPPNCIIVDTVGKLADMYAQADLAYVGSGFSTGVHSVIEPAVHGCAVSFGPNIHILDEAIELYNLGIGKMIHNEDDLQEFISLLDKSDSLKKLQNGASSFVNNKRGGSQKILNTIFSLYD
jgi:3-deoxy-D-manno-octulosonic-acid transferase